MPSGTALPYPPRREIIRVLKETGSIVQINVRCLKAAKNILYTHTHTAKLEGAGRFISAEAIPSPTRAFKKKK